MNKKNIVFLTLIVIIASILRLWQLGKVPSSPDWDEVALGYNAYSIIETGRDEYGKFMPLLLRSFDDYKPALYTYFSIPFISILGLNIFAVRLPSAIFGILTVVVTYFLVRELFKDSRFKLEVGNWKLEIPEVTSLLLAISPWHIQFSRIAFESNVAMGLNAISILLFLKSFKRPFLLLFAAISMGVSFYMYQSEKVFVPLLLIILILVFRKELFMIPKKYKVASVAIIFFIAIPMIYYTLTNSDALARAKGVSIFSDLTPFLKRNVEKLIEDNNNKDYLGLFLDNRRIEFAKSVVSGYISHFDLNWLFVTGDIERHHAPNMGLLYLWELPFLLIGMYSLLFGPFDKKIKIFIISWFLIVPIPASVTSGVPHAVRALNFLPIFQIFTAIGVISFVVFMSNVKYKIANIRIEYLIFYMYILFLTFNILYYLNQYFIQQNYFYSQAWQYGYKDAIDYLNENQDKYDKIIVSNQPHLDQSYMFFLFYLKYPPSLYQIEAKNSSGGFRENHKFGKFEFRPIVWDNEIKRSDILYVGRPQDFTGGVEAIKTINFLNGKPAILIVTG
ncbi:MAG: glycosyltransferase family 39 protein [Patescibacteria group bacterium]